MYYVDETSERGIGADSTTGLFSITGVTISKAGSGITTGSGGGTASRGGSRVHSSISGSATGSIS
jgi:hypothetical protein